MIRYTGILRDPSQADIVLSRLRAQCLPLLPDRPQELRVRDVARNSAANAALHATLQEVAESHEWMGRRWPLLVWKRLLVAAWMRARGESPQVLPALDGHGVDVIFERTSELSQAEVSELIEYINAWRAEQ